MPPSSRSDAPARRCQCGCGQPIPPGSRHDKVFFADACRSAFHRRQKGGAPQAAPDLLVLLAQAIRQARQVRGRPALQLDPRLQSEAEAEALRIACEAQQEVLARIPQGPYGSVRLFSNVADEEALAALGAATLERLDVSHLGLALVPIPSQPGRYAVALAAAGPAAPAPILEDPCQTA